MVLLFIPCYFSRDIGPQFVVLYIIYLFLKLKLFSVISSGSKATVECAGDCLSMHSHHQKSRPPSKLISDTRCARSLRDPLTSLSHDWKKIKLLPYCVESYFEVLELIFSRSLSLSIAHSVSGSLARSLSLLSVWWEVRVTHIYTRTGSSSQDTRHSNGKLGSVPL